MRLLPAPVRHPISLAYLLARLSDTEADGATNASERELLSRKVEIEAWLETDPDRADIEKVWTTIREGQQMDVRACRAERPFSNEELDRYTYLVAGCVGEFWTEICAKKIPGFARLPLGEMNTLGIRFGKGLQLVNILRDRDADARAGRIYVPPGSGAETVALARQCLNDAGKYVRALTLWRLRAACALPVLMGRETLDLVEKFPGVPRVKVSRSRTWLLLARSLTPQSIL